MAWVPDVKRALKGLPVSRGLGFPFSTLGQGGAQRSLTKG